MRWGIIGTGGIAGAFATDLTNLPDHSVVAVGSRTPASADAFGDRFGVPHRHVGVAALVSDPDVEAVYVATPHTEHTAGALAAITAGKHVLVEKPFTVNAFQAQQVVDAARAQGVVVLEAMWTRFLPHVRRLRELLAQKAIGEIRTVYADHGQWFAYDPRFRLFDHSVGGGALLDLGIYPVSWAHLVLGTPSAVTAVGDFTRTGVDAQTSVVLQYPGGAHAVLTTTLEALTPRRAWISGTEGTIEIDPTFYALTGFTLTRRDGHVERYETPAEVVGPRDDGWGKGLRFEAAELARCVAEGLPESPLMPLNETVAVMRTMDEIRRQIGLVYDEEPGPQDHAGTVSLVWADDERLTDGTFAEMVPEGYDEQVDLLLGVLGVPYLQEAGCLTFVADADVEDVLAAFGADTSSPMTLDEAVDAMVDTVAVVRTPDGVVAAEYNGFQGSRPEVLRVLADDGRAASMFWNVNAVTRLSLAEDGATVGGEELVGLDEATAPDLPLDLLPDLVEAARTLTGVEAAGVRAAARWAGVDLSAVHFDDDVVLYPLLPPADDFRPTSPEVTTLAWSEPDLVARIVAAPPATQRAIAEWCALDLVREAGLDTDPAVATATSGFGRSAAPSFEPVAELRESVRRECEVLRRTDPSRHGGVTGPELTDAYRRLSALDALRHACWPVGVEAALGALEHAVRGGPEEHRALREVRLLLDRG